MQTILNMRPKGAPLLCTIHYSTVTLQSKVTYILPIGPLITGRITCSQSEIRLMLLGSPPDMVHGTVLSRAAAP